MPKLKDILMGEEEYKEMINSPAYLRKAEERGLITASERERLEDEYQAEQAEQAAIDAFESSRGCDN